MSNCAESDEHHSSDKDVAKIEPAQQNSFWSKLGALGEQAHLFT